MKKIRAKKTISWTAIIFIFIIVYLFYSRPMPIEERYPVLTLEQCSKITGYYYDGTGTAFQNFTFDKNSNEFDMLCTLLYEQEYRRSLRDLLPRGTRTHKTEPGDFQWEVYFHFNDITFPDGNHGSGGMLHIQSWYDDLDIYFDGERLSCYTKNQDEWAVEILEILR